MTDRPASGVGPDPDRPPDSTTRASVAPAGPPAASVNPPIPVVNVLLERPSAEHLPVSREAFRVASTRLVESPTRVALNRLLTGELPPFPLPATGTRPAAILAAASCPDLFLLDAPVGHARVLATAEIAEQAATARQRVLVLAPDPAFADAVTERLARRGDVVRVLGLGDALERLPPTVLARTETVLAVQDAALRRAKLEQRIADRMAAMAAIDDWHAVALQTHPDSVRAAVLGSEAHRTITETRSQTLAALAAEGELASSARQAVEGELAELKLQLSKPTGLFKRLLGGTKADPDLMVKIGAAEAKLAQLDQDALHRTQACEAANQHFENEFESLLAAEQVSRKTALDAKTDSQRNTLKRLGFAEHPDLREQLAAELADATAELATVNDLPPVLSATAREKLLITVMVFSTEPPAGQFDRIIFAAAEALREADFHAAAGTGKAWVLLGQSGPVVSSRRNRGGAPFFVSLWNAAHRGPWTPDFGYPTARLHPVPRDRQPSAYAEPLVDWPDVELHLFESETGEPVLCEVRFPNRTPLTDVKRLLAEELDCVRLLTVGPARWHVTADQLMCCWPTAENGATRAEWVPLTGGIKERVSDGGPAGLTIAVSFDPAKWTRAAAEEWVARHSTPTPRTAVLPR